MNTVESLRRLEHIVSRLTGDKALRDEATSLVRKIISSQQTTSSSAEWWAKYGPSTKQQPGPAISPQPRALVDLIVTLGPCPVDQVATSLQVSPDYARRLVNRADTQLLDRGGKATISIANGFVHTSTRCVLSFSERQQND